MLSREREKWRIRHPGSQDNGFPKEERQGRRSGKHNRSITTEPGNDQTNTTGYVVFYSTERKINK